jgi:hypothetical protein
MVNTSFGLQRQWWKRVRDDEKFKIIKDNYKAYTKLLSRKKWLGLTSAHREKSGAGEIMAV